MDTPDLEHLMNLYLNLYRFYAADRVRHPQQDLQIQYLCEQLEGLRSHILQKSSGGLDPLRDGIGMIYQSSREALEAASWLQKENMRLSLEIKEIRAKKSLSATKQNAGVQARIQKISQYKHELGLIKTLGFSSLNVKIALMK